MPDKPAKQKRVLRDGRMVKQKKPTSAQNARPTVRWMVHGTSSPTFFKDVLDKRTALGKQFERNYTALVNHLGGEDALTEPERSMVDYAAKFSLLADINWAKLMQDGLFTEDELIHPALDAFMKSAREHRSILQTLGLQRRQKTVPNLSDYISEQKADC